jgi:16S rRNA (guanine527-N7)-methyltransferase
VPDAVRAGLERYLDLLAAWSARVNLTGAATPADRVALLVGDVLPAAPLLRPGRLIDVGSGNGSPGLVLALLRPELPVALLEPRQRRWAFLREACRAAGRPDVEVRRQRHDQYDGPRAATLTVRALDLPLASLAPLVEEGGRVLYFRSRGMNPRSLFEPGRRAPPGRSRGMNPRSLFELGDSAVPQTGRPRTETPGWRAEPAPAGLQSFRRERVSRET